MSAKSPHNYPPEYFELPFDAAPETGDRVYVNGGCVYEVIHTDAQTLLGDEFYVLVNNCGGYHVRRRS